MTTGSGGARAKVAALKTIGEFDCEVGALAKLAVGISRLFATRRIFLSASISRSRFCARNAGEKRGRCAPARVRCR